MKIIGIEKTYNARGEKLATIWLFGLPILKVTKCFVAINGGGGGR